MRLVHKHLLNRTHFLYLCMCSLAPGFHSARLQRYQQYMHSLGTCWDKCKMIFSGRRARLLVVHIDNINTYKQYVPAASTKIRCLQNIQ